MSGFKWIGPYPAEGTPEMAAYARLHAQHSIMGAMEELEEARLSLLSLALDEKWKTLNDRDGQLFTSWEDFAQHKRPEGLGLTGAALRAFEEVRATLTAQRIWDDATDFERDEIAAWLES